jgi:hypothetical protein
VAVRPLDAPLTIFAARVSNRDRTWWSTPQTETFYRPKCSSKKDSGVCPRSRILGRLGASWSRLLEPPGPGIPTPSSQHLTYVARGMAQHARIL